MGTSVDDIWPLSKGRWFESRSGQCMTILFTPTTGLLLSINVTSRIRGVKLHIHSSFCIFEAALQVAPDIPEIRSLKSWWKFDSGFGGFRFSDFGFPVLDVGFSVFRFRFLVFRFRFPVFRFRFPIFRFQFPVFRFWLQQIPVFVLFFGGFRCSGSGD